MWEPDYLDVTEAGDYLKVYDSDDNDELAIAIAAVSRSIDYECNRQFGKVDAVETRTYTPRWRASEARWVVDIDDWMTELDLAVAVKGGSAITDYELGPENAAARRRPWTWLAINRASTVQPYRSSYDRINVTGWPGWTDVPDQVLMASRLQISRLHARRESPFGVAGSPDTGGSELRLLAKLDPDVKVSLRRLVRRRRVG